MSTAAWDCSSRVLSSPRLGNFNLISVGFIKNEEPAQLLRNQGNHLIVNTLVEIVSRRANGYHILCRKSKGLFSCCYTTHGFKWYSQLMTVV